MKKRFPRQEGQSLFEVTVALAVVAIILVAVVGVASVSVRNATFSRSKTLAARLAQETVEWLRSERDVDWETFVSYATIPTRCMPTLSWIQAQVGACGEDDLIPGTIFQREVILTLDNETVQSDVRIIWDDGQGSHEVKVSTFLTDWKAN
jgi:Tfp pilus assembly protein PilV